MLHSQVDVTSHLVLSVFMRCLIYVTKICVVCCTVHRSLDIFVASAKNLTYFETL